MAPSKRKKQRRFLKNLIEEWGDLRLNNLVLGLFEGDIHPDDLPSKQAHVLLARFFKYGRPVVQRIVYALVKTGYFQEFLEIRLQLADENHYSEPVATPAFVRELIQLAETLAGLKGYSRQKLEMFDYRQHRGTYPQKLKALLEYAFGIRNIPDFILQYHLDICPNFKREGISLVKLMAVVRGDKLIAPACNCQAIIEGDIWGYRTTSRDWYTSYLTHWIKQLGGDAAVEGAFVEVAVGFPRKILRHPGFYQVLPLVANYYKSVGSLSENLLSHFLYLTKYYDQWVRPVSDYQFQEGDQEETVFYKNLLNHLFKQYETPIHWYPLYGAHVNNLDEAYRYFIHLAQGKNIRKLDILPYQLSKREAHFFLHAPVELDLPLKMRLAYALRYAKVRVMNGSHELAKQLAEYNLVEHFAAEELRHELITFFINQFPEGHPELNLMLVYLLDQFRQEEKLHLKGVTAKSFLRGFTTFKAQVEESLKELSTYDRFDKELERMRSDIVRYYTQMKSWSSSLHHPFCLEEKGRIIRIDELNNAYSLYKEGRVMGHCVGTYVETCYGNESSVWSVKEYSKDGKSVKRLLTLEVVNGTLNEMKGRFNRCPSKKELRYVKQWLDQEKIEVKADWLKRDFEEMEV